MTVPAVALHALAHAYPDGTPALRGIDLCITRGESVALVGANGAGKSTLLLHLIGLLRPGAGSVQIDGLAVAPATLAAVRQRVGFVFQDADDQLFMPTVHDDVAFGPLNQGLAAAEVAERVATALAAVGASHLARRAPWRLSGGEKRAVAIAGVLAMRPAVLVLDEPSAGLDPAARSQLIGLLGGLPHTRIIATHDLALAQALCPRWVVLHQGRVAADGTPAQVLADADLLRRCRLAASPATGQAAAGAAAGQ